MISPTLLLGSNRFSTALQQNRAQSWLLSLLINITIMSMIILKSYRKMTNKQGARCNLRAKLPEVNTVRVFFFCFFVFASWIEVHVTGNAVESSLMDYVIFS